MRKMREAEVAEVAFRIPNSIPESPTITRIKRMYSCCWKSAAEGRDRTIQGTRNAKLTFKIGRTILGISSMPRRLGVFLSPCSSLLKEEPHEANLSQLQNVPRPAS
jgi:hypothetical protein